MHSGYFVNILLDTQDTLKRVFALFLADMAETGEAVMKRIDELDLPPVERNNPAGHFSCKPFGQWPGGRSAVSRRLAS